MPLVVVIDDLQWADLDSLAVLRLVVPELRRMPVLFIATLRPDDPSDAYQGVRGLLAELASSTVTIHLTALSRAAATEMVTALLGKPATDDLVAGIMDRAGGNPLFIRELIRLLRAERDMDGADDRRLPLPPLMRDILLRRVSRLGETTRRVLEVAAIVGREVSRAALTEAINEPGQYVATAVAEAAADGLVSFSDDVLRFEHDLMREALVDDLSPEHRRALHAAVAIALRSAGGPGSGLSEIAGHLAASGSLVAASDVAEAGLSAGRQSMTQHAPADAAVQFRRGLAALTDDDDPVALTLQLELGRALSALGERLESVEAFGCAAEIARELEDPDEFARAVLGRAEAELWPRRDPDLADLLEEALASREDRRDGLTARLMSSLARELLPCARRYRLAQSAVEVARACADAEALARALYVSTLLNATSANFDERLAASEELLLIGRMSDSPAIKATAFNLHVQQMAEAGDIAAFDADVAAHGSIAREMQNANWQWRDAVHRAMRATMRGDFLEAERLGKEAYGIGRRSDNLLADGTYGTHLLALRTWQGRLEEQLPIVVAAADWLSDQPAVWAAVPYIRSEIGQSDEARSELKRLMADDRMREQPGTESWILSIAMLARSAHLTGSRDAAKRIYADLTSLGSRHIVGPFAECYLGPAVLYRGLCSATIGDLDVAVAEFSEAVVAAMSVGSSPVAAWASAELAVVQRQRGDTAAAERAHSAGMSLEDLGMPRHLARLETAFSEPVVGPEASVEGAGRNRAGVTAPVVEDENVFAWVGDGWSITYEGKTVMVRDSKGARDLHQLITSPHTELHVLHLASEESEILVGAGDQAVLDDRAKREYRRRLTELDEEIVGAEANADLARSERGKLEREALIDELRAAVGLGGRDRAMLAEPERARQAVRARIRYVLDKLAKSHPSLHRHLIGAISTGMYCAYRPERPTRWRT